MVQLVVEERILVLQSLSAARHHARCRESEVLEFASDLMNSLLLDVVSLVASRDVSWRTYILRRCSYDLDLHIGHFFHGHLDRMGISISWVSISSIYTGQDVCRV